MIEIHKIGKMKAKVVFDPHQLLVESHPAHCQAALEFCLGVIHACVPAPKIILAAPSMIRRAAVIRAVQELLLPRRELAVIPTMVSPAMVADCNKRVVLLNLEVPATLDEWPDFFNCVTDEIAFLGSMVNSSLLGYKEKIPSTFRIIKVEA